MTYRVTGIGAFGLSLNWEKVDGDKQIAQNVIAFLEDRRVLFVDRRGEDETYCVRSAMASREFLTEQLAQAKPGKSLATSIRTMRTAFRHFVEVGGPDGRDFRHRPHGYWDADPFSLALGELRGQVGQHVLLIAYHYGIEVEDELAAILPVIADDEAGELEAGVQ